MKIAHARIGLALLAATTALTGCLNLGDASKAPAVVYYVLTDAAPAAVAPLSPATALKDSSQYPPEGYSDPLRAKARVESSAPTLRVLDTSTVNFYDTDKLVFSRSADTRGLYQFARWTERPSKRFAELMRARLDHQGAWNVSAASGGYVRDDLLLDTKLVEFYHDAVSNPGQVRLVLRADLIDTRQRKLLGHRVFEQQVPLTSYDAAGAAQASSLAVSRVLDDLTVWLASLK
ncbi:MAG: ABC-type transport auxiliary lipoprotein family protein [Thiobacillus sp.]|nr:ABC-type transport auxiliary lipoprotein family protein [Thiobacillus sp.]